MKHSAGMSGISPVPFEDLPVLPLCLEGPVPLHRLQERRKGGGREGLEGKTQGSRFSAASGQGGGGAQSQALPSCHIAAGRQQSSGSAPSTHPGTEVDLEDGAVHAAAEHVVLGQVQGHGHDPHVEQHGQQELPRCDFPELESGSAELRA